MKILLVIGVILLSLWGGRAMAQPGAYAVECSPNACQSPVDGTTQPAGTFVAVIQWDGASPWTSPGPKFTGTYALVTYSGQTIYAPPVNAAAQAAGQVAAALGNQGANVNGGVSLTSTATPALNGWYPTSADFASNMNAEAACFLVTTDFCNGTTTKSVIDITGALHSFSIANFKTFFRAYFLYRNTLIESQIELANGITATVPTAAITIP